MQAVGLLHDLGYANVRHYAGGLQEWFAGAPPAETAESHIERTPERPQSIPTSAAAFLDGLASRSVTGLFWLWVETVVVCGAVYWLIGAVGLGTLAASGAPVGSTLRGLASAVYFSAVTATSVGYGDIVPTGAARLLAIAESIAGLILFGCVVSKFVSR